jgi:hypothetical protein
MRCISSSACRDEQLQYFPFQIAVVKRHSGQMGAVEHFTFKRLAFPFENFDRGLRHVGLPVSFCCRRV